MSFQKIHDFAKEILETLGTGYKEHIYVNAMCYHLRKENYLFHNEVIVPIEYNGIQLGYERADIVIYEPFKCVIEFKSQTQSLSKKEYIQIKKYLKNLNLDTGILINFGNLNGNLEYQEYIYDDNKESRNIIHIEDENLNENSNQENTNQESINQYTNENTNDNSDNSKKKSKKNNKNYDTETLSKISIKSNASNESNANPNVSSNASNESFTNDSTINENPNANPNVSSTTETQNLEMLKDELKTMLNSN